MGTRSFVAEPRGDSYAGRYVHWDGYPTHMGATLWRLVERDGLERVRQVLLHEHAGWSNLKADYPDFTGVVADRNAPYGSPERELWVWETCHSDGRFAPVIGYGVAYTTTILEGHLGQARYQQVKDEDWITPEGDDYGTEWGYVLGEGGLMVLKVEWRGDRQPSAHLLVGMFPWGVEPDWEQVQQQGYRVAGYETEEVS